MPKKLKILLKFDKTLTKIWQKFPPFEVRCTVCESTGQRRAPSAGKAGASAWNSKGAEAALDRQFRKG